MDLKKVIIALVIIILIVGIAAYGFIAVNSADTKIEITVNSPAKNGDNITLQLKDSYRKVYPDQSIDVKILDDSGWAHKYTVTTDSDGCGYVPIETMDNGEYTVHADFNGTMFLSKSSSFTTFTVDDGL